MWHSDRQLKITHPANPVVVSNVSWTNVTFENSNGVQRIAVELPLGGAQVDGLTFDNVVAPRGNFTRLVLLPQREEFSWRYGAAGSPKEVRRVPVETWHNLKAAVKRHLRP